MTEPQASNIERRMLLGLLDELYRINGEDAVLAILKQQSLDDATIENVMTQVKERVSTTPKETPEQMMAKAYNVFAHMYHRDGEDRARAALQEQGFPDDMIAQFITQAKQIIEDEQQS